MSENESSRVLRLNAGLAGAYFLSGWLGLQVPQYGAYVTLVWVPTAIALAAIILRGPVLLPGAFLGSLAVNLLIEPRHPAACAVIAFGNALGPAVAGTALVRRFHLRPQLDRVRDAFAYLVVGVLGTGVITASLGALWLCVFGVAPWGEYSTVWLTWFGGEAAGSLIVGPLVLTWLTVPDPLVARLAPPLEKAAMALTLALATAIVLVVGERLASLPYVFGFFLGWILIRAGMREAFLALVAIGLVLVVGTAIGTGPFAAHPPHSGMLSCWMFLASTGSGILIGGGLVAERDRAIHHQQRLLAELDHRVKNTLATVSALAERSSDDAVDLDDYRSRFIGRVRAIARTHEGLAQLKWECMRVADVVEMTLEPFAGNDTDRLTMRGTATTLTAATVAPVTMVLHELATNAAKYGAWSREGGRVDVDWERSEVGALRLRWSESGGPAVLVPPTPGYGLTLITGTVVHELGGRASIQFPREGLVCVLEVPSD